MEMQQICFDYTSAMRQNSLKRLIYSVHNLEERLVSVKSTHDKLYELMSIVTRTHASIVDDLATIKTILNQALMEQEEDEIIPIDGTKSEWDDDDDDDNEENFNDEFDLKKSNKSIQQQPWPSIESIDPTISSSASPSNLSPINGHRPSSSTSKRSSSMKKHDRLSSSRTKSPKSVTFNLHEDVYCEKTDEQRPSIEESIQAISNEKKSDSIGEVIVPILPGLPTDTLNENQVKTIPKIENEKRIITNIRIHEIEPKNGSYLRLLNISNSDDYDLGGHYIQQSIYSKTICCFRFPLNTIIRAGQTVTIWCGALKDIIPQPPYVFVWNEQQRWEVTSQCVTILAKPDGQSIAWFRTVPHMNIHQSSSDILLIRSRSTAGTSDISTSNCPSASINKRQSRYLPSNGNGNGKPPFAHSPSSLIHPDYSGTVNKLPNDLRSKLNLQVSKNGLQLLNRPKSSPFASHMGCKQDLLSKNILQTQQLPRSKQTTVKV